MLMLTFNGIFVMMMGQQIVSHALIQSAKSLAFDPYSSQRATADQEDKLADMFIDIFSFSHGDYVSTDEWYADSGDDIADLVEERFSAYLKSSYTDANYLLEKIGIEGGMSGMDFSESVYENDVLTIKVTYTQNYPFNAGDLTSFQRTLCVQVKLFEYKS
jgi:hypothetical protein